MGEGRTGRGRRVMGSSPRPEEADPMGIPGWECVSVWCGGREGAGLPHLADPAVCTAVCSLPAWVPPLALGKVMGP